MADRPIIFSAPMIRALLEGRKTQTRRLIKPQPYTVEGVIFTWGGPKGAFLCGPQDVASNLRDFGAIRYAPGDRLWVREAWCTSPPYDDLKPSEMGGDESIRYSADGAWETWGWGNLGCIEGRLRPSIHMPRWASRLTLLVTDVRVQRLQEISEEDAKSEGAPAIGAELCPPDLEDTRSYIWGFHNLWNSIHGPGAWAANPWVAAITFDVKRGNIDTPTISKEGV